MGEKSMPATGGRRAGASEQQFMTDEATPRGIAAVLLAAGLSERMVDANKLLLEVGGVPMVRRTAEAILGCGVCELVVVLGHDCERVAEALRGLSCTCVFNGRYTDGQMTSVHAGLAAVSPGSDAVMICLADQPLLSPEDYRSLIAASASLTRGQVAVPTVKGERGNPIIFPAFLKDEILERGMTFGCRNLIRDNPALVAPIEMNNPNFIRDIDTREAYQAIIA